MKQVLCKMKMANIDYWWNLWYNKVVEITRKILKYRNKRRF